MSVLSPKPTCEERNTRSGTVTDSVKSPHSHRYSTGSHVALAAPDRVALAALDRVALAAPDRVALSGLTAEERPLRATAQVTPRPAVTLLPTSRHPR
mgnify:FL=1